MKTTTIGKFALSLLVYTNLSVLSIGMEKPLQKAAIAQSVPSREADVQLAQEIHDDLFRYKETSKFSMDYSYKYPTISEKIEALSGKLGKIIEERTSKNTTNSIPQLLNFLEKIMIDNIGGWTGGKASEYEGSEESQHLVLAHFISDLLKKMGMNLDDNACFSYEKTGLITSVNISCKNYLAKHALNFTTINKQQYDALLNALPNPFQNISVGTQKKPITLASSKQESNILLANKIFSITMSKSLENINSYLINLKNTIKMELSGKNEDTIITALTYLAEIMMDEYEKAKNLSPQAGVSGQAAKPETILLLTFSLENAMRKIYYDKGYDINKWTRDSSGKLVISTMSENVDPELKKSISALYDGVSRKENINAYENYKKSHVFSASAEGAKILETIKSIMNPLSSVSPTPLKQYPSEMKLSATQEGTLFFETKMTQHKQTAKILFIKGKDGTVYAAFDPSKNAEEQKNALLSLFKEAGYDISDKNIDEINGINIIFKDTNKKIPSLKQIKPETQKKTEHYDQPEHIKHENVDGINYEIVDGIKYEMEKSQFKNDKGRRKYIIENGKRKFEILMENKEYTQMSPKGLKTRIPASLTLIDLEESEKMNYPLAEIISVKMNQNIPQGAQKLHESLRTKKPSREPLNLGESQILSKIPSKFIESKIASRKLTDDEIDQDYNEFMKNIGKYNLNITYDEDSYISKEYILKKENAGLIVQHYEDKWPNIFNKELYEIVKHIPEGNYSYPTNTWIANYNGTEVPKYNPSEQGWKIHITAQPHSAKKIAELILLHANDLNEKFGIESNKLEIKIIPSIPIIRSMWYLYSNLIDTDTQAGKFIVVYPKNTQHSYELVKLFNNILNEAIARGELNPETDFLPLIGDAKVGTSGGVYVRYGGFTYNKGYKINLVEPNDKKANELYTEHDDRNYPWLNFMNKGNNYWKDSLSPFKELKLEWTPGCKLPNPSINPGKLQCIGLPTITWDTRPISWEMLEKKKEKPVTISSPKPKSEVITSNPTSNIDENMVNLVKQLKVFIKKYEKKGENLTDSDLREMQFPDEVIKEARRQLNEEKK